MTNSTVQPAYTAATVASAQLHSYLKRRFEKQLYRAATAKHPAICITLPQHEPEKGMLRTSLAPVGLLR